ncbi:SEC-C metal-binding domain-containing protein [Chloroflexota bacterium]
MTRGNSTSVVAIRLPDAVVGRIKTMARRKRQTVNEMLKKVILGYVAGEYYSEEQVARLCELEPLAWKGVSGTIAPVQPVVKNNPQPPAVIESPTGDVIPRVSKNALCPCGSGKRYKKCHGRK